MEPAPLANDPLCADVGVRLPKTIGQNDRVWTDAQATAAWGDPSVVLYTCGLEPPGPSTLQCVSFSGVDWLVDDADYPQLRLTTYGRTPAVQLYVDTEQISGDAALDAISMQVAALPQNAQCTTADEADPEQDAPQTS
ncbi:MAG TPA: DUF3515 domain-containing protein [Candidatus Microbacterium stercoravium]|uniref:DUF3515 domain-containing protein n=1 Tax=Candidatus Microbacterium stercoravium TaxID=2838697 RepID=A0A9D2H5P6_9MICO|nr:DUF3515 domain-containing protein [Candidatus Microbacterium stercoravium]